MPAVVGLIVDQLSNAVQPLTCLDGVTLVGPDGKILAGTGSGTLLRIASVSPAPGTPVGPHDPVTVNVETVDQTSPPAHRPCDWVTPTEAAEFLGVSPITATPDGDEQGSTDTECDYSHGSDPDDNPRGDHSISSELRLTEAHVVDAASEYAFTTAKDSTAVDGIGIKAACTTMPNSAADKSIHQLHVLLPGERLYIATGAGGESCEILERFAQAAIPRIGA
jgi:hypothetical protein